MIETEDFFEIFPWNENFESGIQQIDDEHKKLVDILNNLAAHLAHRSSEVILNEVFDELAEYADYHFKSEEKIWSEYFKDDEWRREHVNTHGSFMDEVIRLRNNKDDKPLDNVVYDIVSFLSKWLAYHILDTDKRMAIAVTKMQAGHSIEEAKTLASEDMSGSMRVIVDTVLVMYDTLSSRTLDLMREKALRKKAEEELKRSEERWKFVIESDSENVWDWDIENDVLVQSDNLDSIYEVTGSRLRSKNSKSSNIHPADIERVNKDFNAHINGETDFYVNKHRLLREDGGWSWILSRGKVISRDENGTPLRMIGTHSDITEKELAKLVYQNTSQAIFICNANNEIISINPAFTEITGYSERDIIGKDPNILSSGKHDKEFYDDMWKSINSVGHWSGEIYNKTKSGRIYPEHIDINRIVDEDGSVDHYCAMFNDITEIEKHKQYQEKQKQYLLQQSRMAQMGELISMIAHQWRQPLSIIGSTSASMQMKLALNKFDLKDEKGIQEYKDYFNTNLIHIDELLQSLSSTMNDFRNFYNPNKENVKTLISSPVTKALYIIRASMVSDGVVIEERYDSEELVDMFENEIIQVILNILKNAQDNFKEKQIQTPKINIMSKTHGDIVSLEICDNGGGISEDIIDSVFEPYFSTKTEQKGTGLGLNMSKTIIESHHNGKIYAKNTDEGVCFIIELKHN